jgi:hypothetical protein
MEWLIALCISLLGSDSWRTREYSQRVLQYMVETFDRPEQLKKTIKTTRDLEVKYRCLRALRRYQHCDIPKGLLMSHFDRIPYGDLWQTANKLPYEHDVQEYVRLLINTGVRPAHVRQLIKKANNKRQVEAFKQALFNLQWEGRNWLEQRMPFFFPPWRPNEGNPDGTCPQ